MSAIASDDLWPRDEAHRYRVYVLDGKEPTCVRAAPDAQGVGLAIFDVAEEQRARDGAALVVGVLDALAGRWVTSMWQPGVMA